MHTTLAPPLRALALTAFVSLSITALVSPPSFASPVGGSVWTTAEGSADVSIALTANPGEVTPGQRVNFKSVVANAGPDRATHVKLVEDLPGSGSLFEVDPAQGACSVQPSTITCKLGSIRAGKSVEVDLVWFTPTKPTGLFTQAIVSADQGDPNGDNNQASAGSQPCLTDCTGGWVPDGGQVDGPPVGGDVTQSADIVAPPGVRGPLSSQNQSESPCQEPPDFVHYGQVFVVEVPAATGTRAYTFRLTLVTSEDPEVGVPPHEPLKDIEVIRGCVELPHCLTSHHNLRSIPKGADGCIFKVRRDMRTKDVVITTLDTGQDPPIRGGG